MENNLEARIKVIEEQNKELTTQNQVLQRQLKNLQDIEEIKKLQRAYGFYLEHWMVDEIMPLFSDRPDVLWRSRAGELHGKVGIRKFFDAMKLVNNEFLHQVMQISGIVDVAPDGKTATGRWYGFGALAIPNVPVENGVCQRWIAGVYENDYIKEDDKWKFWKLHWGLLYSAPYKDGWVSPSRASERFAADTSDLKSDGPHENTEYPSGYIMPFHFKNPVTGK
jgi:hypothetical protein